MPSPSLVEPRLPSGAAFGVGQVSVLASRKKDVNRQWVVFGAHGVHNRFSFADGFAQVFESALQPIRVHLFIRTYLPSRVNSETGQLIETGK